MGKKDPKKAHDAWAKILAKAWSDELFKQRLLTNPKKVLQEYGFPLDEKTKYEVIENSKNTVHLVIPNPPEGKFSEEELRKIAGGGAVPATDSPNKVGANPSRSFRLICYI